MSAAAALPATAVFCAFGSIAMTLDWKRENPGTKMPLGVLGIFAEGTVGFRETELLPFQDGAVEFASTSGVPILPCAIVGSTFMWFRRRVVFRYGDPIPADEFVARATRRLNASRAT